MDNYWLKFRKTPLISSKTATVPSSPGLDNLTNPFEMGEDVEEDPKQRPSRVSTMLNFGKQLTPTTDSFPFNSPTFASETYHGLMARAAEAVWHKPNPVQMAETLKVSMMTRGNFAPIPVEYNSNILFVLEAFYKQGEDLKRRDRELNELRVQLTDQMDQVELLGKEWSLKESQYKTEVKKLELMVARGVTGLEAVTLARSKSILDRTTTPIEEKIRKIREGSNSSKTTRRSKMTTRSGSSAREENEIKLSKMFSQKKHPRPEKHVTEHFRPYKDPFVEAEKVQPRVELRDRPVVRNKRADSRPSIQRYGSDSSSSSDSDAEDADDSEESPFASTTAAKGKGKPFPRLPSAGQNDALTLPTQDDESEFSRKTHAKSDSHSRAFSYVPGDDTFELRKLESSPVPEDLIDSGAKGWIPNVAEEFRQYSPPEADKSLQQRQLWAKHLEQLELAKPKRGDSTSSVVTAIRDRNSTDMGASHSGSVQKSSNAVIAATRAMSVANGKEPAKES